MLEPRPQYQNLASSLSIPIARERLGMIPPRGAEVSRARAQWAPIGDSSEEEKKEVMGWELTFIWTTIESVNLNQLRSQRRD